MHFVCVPEGKKWITGRLQLKNNVSDVLYCITEKQFKREKKLVRKYCTRNVKRFLFDLSGLQN